MQFTRVLRIVTPPIFTCYLVFCSALAAHNLPCTSTGDLEIVPFDSKVFPTPRSLRILLPAGYRLPASRKLRYPVLYLNDGQNLFDVCTSVFNQEEWQVDETVIALIAAGKLPPIIVVGIDNAGKRLRPSEYLPYPDDTLAPPEPNPMGKLYPRFLLDEVVPYVENHYRVMPGTANRALGGSSYGAGIAFFTVINRPDSFAALLLEGPSIYADSYHLLRDAASVREWPKRVFIGTGTVNEPVEDVEKLKALFQKAGLSDDRLRVVVQSGAAHSERWWAQRLPEALQFLFSRSRKR
jgi:enterochelin esterase-like enzyme